MEDEWRLEDLIGYFYPDMLSTIPHGEQTK
jgi:hypothetical protein